LRGITDDKAVDVSLGTLLRWMSRVSVEWKQRAGNDGGKVSRDQQE
jgi:hypothetical protein